MKNLVALTAAVLLAAPASSTKYSPLETAAAQLTNPDVERIISGVKRIGDVTFQGQDTVWQASAPNSSLPRTVSVGVTYWSRNGLASDAGLDIEIGPYLSMEVGVRGSPYSLDAPVFLGFIDGGANGPDGAYNFVLVTNGEGQRQIVPHATDPNSEWANNFYTLLLSDTWFIGQQ